MTKTILKALAIAVLLAGIVGAQTRVQAQEKAPKPATEKKEKKASAGPFHGKLAGLDKAAKTITVGKRTFQITSETRISKEGKPATLDDGVVGEEVSGYVKPAEDGKLVATKINFGPKAESKGAKGGEKKKES